MVFVASTRALWGERGGEERRGGRGDGEERRGGRGEGEARRDGRGEGEGLRVGKGECILQCCCTMGYSLTDSQLFSFPPLLPLMGV